MMKVAQVPAGWMEFIRGLVGYMAKATVKVVG